MTNEQSLIKYENLSNKKKVEVLYNALFIMQQYNGRSIEDCILLAMQ